MAIPALPPITGYDFRFAVEHPDCYVSVYNLNPGDGFRIRTYSKDGNLTVLGTLTSAYGNQYHSPNDMIFSADDNSVWISHGAYGVAGYTITSSGATITQQARTTEAMGAGQQDYYYIAVTSTHVWAVGNISGLRVFVRNGTASINTSSVFNYTNAENWLRLFYFENADMMLAGTTAGNWYWYDATTFGSLTKSFGGDGLHTNYVTAEFVDENVRNARVPKVEFTRNTITQWNLINDDRSIVQIANYDPVGAPDPYLAIVDTHESDMWCYMRMNDFVTGSIVDASTNNRDFTTYGNASIVDPIFNTHTVDNTTDGAIFSDDWTWYAELSEAGWANGNTDFSIAAWFRFDDTTNSVAIVNANSSSSSAQVAMIVSKTTGRLWAGRYIGSWNGVYSTHLEPGRLYHAVYTYSASSGGRLYLDGVLRDTNSNTTTLSITQTKTQIGREAYSDVNTAPTGQHRLNGAIGEVIILTKELTATDIIDLYNEGLDNPRTGTYDQQILDLSPHAYFPLDEYGGNLIDLSGNANFLVPNTEAEAATTYQITGQVGDGIFVDGDVNIDARFSGVTAPDIFPIGTDTLSFDLWMKDEIMTTPGTTYNRFVEIGANDDTGTERFFLGCINETSASATDRRRIFAGTDQATVSPVTAYNVYNNQRGDGRWHHYAVTFDASNQKIKFFVDAVQINENSVTITPTTKALAITLAQIAQSYGDATPKTYFQKLAIYDAVLTDAQIIANYEKGKNLTIPTALNDYEQSIYDNEPTSYWPLDETSGNTAYDRMGRVNLSFVNGSADTMTTTGLLTNESQPCLQFNGSNQYLTVNNSITNQKYDAYTIESLVLIDTVGASRRDIVGNAEAGGWSLDMSTSGRFNMHARTESLGSGYADVDDNKDILAGEVYHVAGVFDGQYMRLYVNGVFRDEYDFGTVSPIYWDRVCEFVIGCQWNDTSLQYYWPGKISHVALYDKVIPNAELVFRKRFLIAKGINNQDLDTLSLYEKTVVNDNAFMLLNLSDVFGDWVFNVVDNDLVGETVGTPINATSIIPDSLSMDFDGNSNEYVSIDDSQFPAITDKISFEVWVKSDNASYRTTGTWVDTGAIMFRRSSFGFHPSGANLVNVYVSVDGNWTTNPMTIPDPDEWNHLVCTWDGATGDMLLYLNGYLHLSDLGGQTGLFSGDKGTYPDSNLYIGSDHPTTFTTRRFDGKIDMPAIYTSILTSEQVLNHYLIGRSNLFPAHDDYSAIILADPNVVAYWRMEDLQTSDQISDIVGGHNMTVYGDPTREIPAVVQNGMATDGIDDYLRTTDSIIQSTNDLSVEFFFMLPSSSKQVNIVKGRDGFGSGWSFNIFVDNTGLNFNLITSSPSNVQNTSFVPFTPSVGVWYHAVVIFNNGANLQVYINGARTVLESITGTNIRTSTYGWSIGLGLGSDSIKYAGGYDELAVYEGGNPTEEAIQNHVKVAFGLEDAFIETDAYRALIESQSPTNYSMMNEPNGHTLLDCVATGINTRAWGQMSPSNEVVFGSAPIIGERTSVRFDATNDTRGRFTYGRIGAMTTAHTISFWIKPDVVGAYGTIYSANSYYATATSDFPFAYRISGDDIIAEWSSNNDYSIDLTLSAKLNPGEANHVAFVWANNTNPTARAEIWINGVKKAKSTPSFWLASNTRHHSIGAPAFSNGAGANTEMLTGVWLSDMAIWHSDLTAQQIRDQYITGSDSANTLNGLIVGDIPTARWRLEETSAFEFEEVYTNFTHTNIANRTFGGPALTRDSERSIAIDNPSIIDGSGYGPDVLGGKSIYTVEVWIQPGDALAGNIYSESQAGGQIMSVQYLVDGQIYVKFHDGSDWADGVSSGEIIPKNRPSHIVYTRSGRVALIYINGRLVKTGDHGSSNGSNNVSSGANRGGIGVNPHDIQASSGFTGWIDELTIYYDVLTATEVLDHYNAGYTGTNYDGLLGYQNAHFRLPMNDSLSGDMTVDVLRGIEFTNSGLAETVDNANGFMDRCLEFDGNNQTYNDLNGSGHYIRAAYADLDIDFNSSLTLSAWINPVGKTSGELVSCVASIYDSAGDRMYFNIIWDATNSNFTISATHLDNSTPITVGNGATATRIEPGEWSHVAYRFMYSGGNLTISLFINGVELADYNAAQTFSAPTLSFSNSPPLAIGETFNGTSSYNHYDGLIDEIVFHKYDLSDQGILDLFNATADEYRINGSVTQDGNPAERQVYVYRRSDGEKIASITSVGGIFDIRWREIYPDTEYFVVALDDAVSPDLQPIAQDRIVPVVVT